MQQDTTMNLLDVLANDTDPDLPAETLTITGIGGTSANGTLTDLGALLEYAPLPGFTGTETFSYRKTVPRRHHRLQ